MYLKLTFIVLYGEVEEIRNVFDGMVPVGLEIIPSVAGDSKKTSLRNLVASVNENKIEGIYTIGILRSWQKRLLGRWWMVLVCLLLLRFFRV